MLTKRLNCRKRNDTIKLEKYSLKHAIDIIKLSETGLFNDYNDSFMQFKKAFPRWNSLLSPAVNSCLKVKFESKLMHIEKLYASYGIKFYGYFEKLKMLNKFDMELYMYIASSLG